MIGVLKNIKPERVFYYFEQISNIPRCSGNEKKISDYIYKWAKEKNLFVIQDDYNNIYIKKSSENTNSDGVLLQGHMDMVCEKNTDCKHDFSNEGIELILDGDYVRANNTSLGADNGIGLAMIMSVLESDDVNYPSIEALFTTEEETGMDGIRNFDASVVTSRRLINLDSDEEGFIITGCAGGGRVYLKIPKKCTSSKYSNSYQIFVKGLKGGHSGNEIHKDRGNANKILGRLLFELNELVEICSINGGMKDNAIPREASALVKTDIENIHEFISDFEKKILNEYSSTEVDLKIEIVNVPDIRTKVFDANTQNKIINLINLIPSGVLKRDDELNLVISSNNLGVIKDCEDYIEIVNAPRSSIKSLFDDAVIHIGIIAKLLKIEMELKSVYPGWQYNKESYISEEIKGTYKELYYKEPRIKSIHAGLECGFLIEKIENMDSVSFGPDILDIHTPDEKFSISSVQRTYELLCSLLRNINNNR